jgi:hypothetical protein
VSLTEVLARRTFERPVRTLMDAEITDALAAARKAATEPVVVASAAAQAAPAVAAAAHPGTDHQAKPQDPRKESRPSIAPPTKIDVTV